MTITQAIVFCKLVNAHVAFLKSGQVSVDCNSDFCSKKHTADTLQLACEAASASIDKDAIKDAAQTKLDAATAGKEAFDAAVDSL